MNVALNTGSTKSRAFTLIELLISLAIIALITGAVVFNQSDYSDRLSLSNAANDMVLDIRQAQIYGVSVREFAPGTSEFNLAYGISFNIGNPGSSNTSYILFADRAPSNGYYDTPLTCLPGALSECLDRSTLTRGNTITNLCVVKNDNSTQCAPSPGRIDITFLRPNPNANIIFFNNAGNQVSFGNYKGAKIELTSPHGLKKYVYIYTTGQVSIQ